MPRSFSLTLRPPEVIGPNVQTIPAGIAFARALAEGLIDQLRGRDDPLVLASATIYLPTRRAARTLAETFSSLLGGSALLPRMLPLGNIPEEEILAAEEADSELAPAVSPIRRRLLLATLIQRWGMARGKPHFSFGDGAALAQGLSSFLDEVETQGADLGRLLEIKDLPVAAHWEEIRDFLAILNNAWPAMLASYGLESSTRLRNLALDRAARSLRERPPAAPVIAAGSTGSVPATARLLSAIASLPQGTVLLPGLDLSLDEASWNALDESHAQYGMKQLLERIGIERSSVKVWAGIRQVDIPRTRFLREALRPPPTTDAWLALVETQDADVKSGLQGVSLLEAAHPQEEAASIALVLRDALRSEDQTAALVTPDRNLARRVAAELRRWNIEIDDSAGRPLAKTIPGAFLQQILDAAAESFAPIALLALLKHPLASCGMRRDEFRAHVSEIDRFILRGPRPDPGLRGIEAAITAHGNASRMHTWFAKVKERLADLEAAMRAEDLPLAKLLEIFVRTAEGIAETDLKSGSSRLWAGEAGTRASELIAQMNEAADDTLPPLDPFSFIGVFRTLLGEVSVRLPFGRHPRLSILGPLEARLQSFDVVVLGGLNEGTWPSISEMDPWLSRAMRKAIGLEQPERAIGLAAHDFVSLAAAAPRLFLTRSTKSGGAPTIASRWLQRLQQLARGFGIEKNLVADTDYVALAPQLEELARCNQPVDRPAPCPPVRLRPRSLSVTEIEVWVRDPYAIYARHVLKLDPLDALDAEIGALERGNTVHAALEEFVRRFPDKLPEDADEQLQRLADEVFSRARIPGAVLAIWRPRFRQIADWFVNLERSRREDVVGSRLEIRGRMNIAVPRGPFTLRCRADRIDILNSGMAAIIDYKTGYHPTPRQAELMSPQLPLEGAILEAGGFDGLQAIKVAELLYIKLKGGNDPGEVTTLNDAARLIATARQNLVDYVIAFDDERRPYLSQRMPFKRRTSGPFDHLARVAEWSRTRESDE